MLTNSINKKLIDRFILPGEQDSYDPYDIWNTFMGQKIKLIFYNFFFVGMLPAAFLTCFDYYINNKLRIGYKKKEYPVVYAFRALISIRMYEIYKKPEYLNITKDSLTWLSDNYSKGYKGCCWGANMPWVSKNATYSINTPYITNTPYALEAFYLYSKASGDDTFDKILDSVYNFVEKDLKKLVNRKTELALSYSPIKEKRIVINANSYAMLCYSIFRNRNLTEAPYIEDKIYRLYTYIKNNQREDGSWFYYADELNGNFIDCFHTCFILKNLFKVNMSFPIAGCSEIITKGYQYLKESFFDHDKNLFKRFSKSNKLSLVRFDLYDNAEMLNLAHLLNDEVLTRTLEVSIKTHFVVGSDIYSQIVIPNKRVNKNMLRWAVMPYLQSLSNIS